MPSCAILASSAFRRSVSASETRTWPQAGCSIASATTACSISTGVRFFRIGLRRLISCNASSPPLSYSSAKMAQDGILLTEAQIAALEKAKADKEAYGEFESECPGYCGAQDTFYVGTLKG